nr:hypothetical protein [Tanacetum cinerariifolium]
MIKECSSCGTLYTRDYCCSKGNVEDKILVPKPPKNCARCGHPVDGPYCQGCTFLRKKLEEDLVTHSQDFQNTFESSDDSTNVVNAPREPFVVKQDHGSFVDKIICDLNKAPDSPHIHTFSPNQFHCFHCKDVLGDGEACQRCTCTSISANSSQNPPHIDERCYECSDALDGIFCQQCTRKSCGKGAHIGYNCPPKCQPMNQNFYNSNSLGFDQTKTLQFPVVHPPPQETSIEILHDQENDRVFKIKDAFGNEQYKPEDIQELFRKLLTDVQNIHEELAEYINTPGWNRPALYNNGNDDDLDYTIAITPVLSTDEPNNSLSIPDTMCDVHLVNNPTPFEAKDHFEIVINSNDDYSSSDDDSLYYENIEYVEASPHGSELVSLEVEKIVILEDEEIKDENLREKMLKVNLQIAEIEALKDNPTPSSEFLTKSSSTSPKSFLEETNTFHDSLPEFKNFCFDLEEISSGSTTTHSDISLSEYDSFIFNLSKDQFPPTDRSDFTHEEFSDELAHIISPPEIRENLSSTTCVNLPVEDDHSPVLAYVVWIFLAYLTHPVIPLYLYSFRNEDTIFDPGITINRFYSFKPGLSHRCGTFKKFNTHRSHLNESPMEMLFSTFFPMNQFMNYLEVQTDGKAMTNSIQNGDQPLSVIAQVSLAGNAHNAPHTLKDPKFWTAEEKKLERLIKCGYKKDNFELNYKFLNNLQPEWKQYGEVNDALGYKKKAVVVTSDQLALVAEKTKVTKRNEKVEVQSESEESDEEDIRHFAKDCKKAKVKDYNYYKTKMLLAKKDSDEQVLLAKDQAWMESSSDSDQEINANMAFMAQIEKSMGDLLNDNNFFIFDDESVRISPVSKMPFRKKPSDSMNVRSKSNSNKSLPRTV